MTEHAEAVLIAIWPKQKRAKRKRPVQITFRVGHQPGGVK